MTALKVYNWFANRRKEMKRRANIGERGDARRDVAYSLMHPQKMHFQVVLTMCEMWKCRNVILP